MFFLTFVCSLLKLLLFLDINNYQFNSKFLFIPCYILIVLIKAYTYTKIKWLIDIRYISISKMLFIYGVFGFLISLIICIFTCNFPGFIGDAFGNFPSQSYSINWWEFIIEIFLIIVFMGLNFLIKFYNLMTLKIFSPIHVLIISSGYYLVIRIILILNSFTHLFYDGRESGDNTMSVYTILINIFAIFGYLVFVEVIELKCCGCNYNLKKSIINRSRIETIDIQLYAEINKNDEDE